MRRASGGRDGELQPTSAKIEAVRAAYLSTEGIKVTGSHLQAIAGAIACNSSNLPLQCHCG